MTTVYNHIQLRGLAGQLPGPPLKEPGGRRRRPARRRFGRAIARPSIEGQSSMRCFHNSPRFGRAIARPSIEGAGSCRPWWPASRGLAGQLPGPPLKAAAVLSLGVAGLGFGRAIARPSIEGTSFSPTSARTRRLAGQLPGPPLKELGGCPVQLDPIGLAGQLPGPPLKVDGPVGDGQLAGCLAGQLPGPPLKV